MLQVGAIHREMTSGLTTCTYMAHRQNGDIIVILYEG